MTKQVTSVAGRYRHHVRMENYRNKIRKKLMKFLPDMEHDPLVDGWASGYHIAEKFSEVVRAPYSSFFNTLVASILYEEVCNGRLEWQQHKGKGSDLAACLYRLPNALERLAQL